MDQSGKHPHLGSGVEVLPDAPVPSTMDRIILRAIKIYVEEYQKTGKLQKQEYMQFLHFSALTLLTVS